MRSRRHLGDITNLAEIVSSTRSRQDLCDNTNLAKIKNYFFDFPFFFLVRGGGWQGGVGVGEERWAKVLEASLEVAWARRSDSGESGEGSEREKQSRP